MCVFEKERKRETKGMCVFVLVRVSVGETVSTRAGRVRD